MNVLNFVKLVLYMHMINVFSAFIRIRMLKRNYEADIIFVLFLSFSIEIAKNYASCYIW